MNNKEYISDWLASRPIFYNEKTGKVSENINNVIDFRNMEFHSEGFYNYLAVGFSILEQTPIKNVKFLRHSSRLSVDDSGNINIQYLDDPVEKYIGKSSNENNVLELIRSKVQEWEAFVDGEIIIPTSGGYDSRLLNLMIKDKIRIRSFTYGISYNQSKSFEVVYAKKLSQIVNTKWEQIELGDFHKYLDELDALYGISSYARGGYQIEFYKKVLPKIKLNSPLLSGAFGDDWSGSRKFKEITSEKFVLKLANIWGRNAEPSMSLLKSDGELLYKYFNNLQEKLKIPEWCSIEESRFQVIYLSRLITIPEYLGFKPWSPFLDIDVAMAMTNLPYERRKGRSWQKEFFKKNNVDFEDMNLKSVNGRTLDYYAMARVPLKPLDVKVLSEVVKPEYVEWINSGIRKSSLLVNFLRLRESFSFLENFFRIRKRNSLPKLNFFGFKENKFAPYYAYLTLKPIENIIIKRNNA